jgi:hypothetical protein
LIFGATGPVEEPAHLIDWDKANIGNPLSILQKIFTKKRF